jgi:microcompartment protein CcmL/EutN
LYLERLIPHSLEVRHLHFSPPALALLEIESLSRGLVVADALLKRAVVTLSRSEAVSPGKHLLIFSGSVAEVEESFLAGLAAGQGFVIDSLLLPQVAPGLVEGLKNSFATRAVDESLGFVETNSVAGALKAADVALKSAQVKLTAIWQRASAEKGFSRYAAPSTMSKRPLSAQRSVSIEGCWWRPKSFSGRTRICNSAQERTRFFCVSRQAALNSRSTNFKRVGKVTEPCKN